MPLTNLKESKLHPDFKQYSEMCDTNLIDVICSKHEEKKSFTMQKDVLQSR